MRPSVKDFAVALCKFTFAVPHLNRKAVSSWPEGSCAQVLLPEAPGRINLLTMTDLAGPVSQNGKHRRSKRLPLSIPVRVYGRTLDNRPFRDITETKSVSVHGGLLPLAARVKRGQTLLLVNAYTGEERECRVVYVESKRRNRKVGVEFTDVKGDFWHVYSPVVELRHDGNTANKG